MRWKSSGMNNFKENAKILVGSYNGNYYMLIEGIDNPILVRQYDTNS